ncbi:unnamed protein product [Didymodactylos carnosus]|uniref:Uncharacterized protein n=1 Tax=Didymodactylos carnosus TaxID=1234261 RepID=A0A814MVX1_9BILA|nr:unnamed protein product [Didymodactylos carnosus]CAF3849760.1 unnamed protein product [Didymodactylos carnosus]
MLTSVSDSRGYPSLLSDAIRKSYDNASSATTNQVAQRQRLAPLTFVSTYNPNNLDLFPFIRSLLPQMNTQDLLIRKLKEKEFRRKYHPSLNPDDED